MRQRLSQQLLHEDSICESNEKEQRPDGHVREDDESGAVQKSETQSDWRKQLLHHHYDHNLRFHPIHRSLLTTPPLVDPSLALPFPADDDYIHPPDSEPYNNNNSSSVVDKRPCRSNISKPIDTPSKQERETRSQAQPASTFTAQDEDDFLSWAAAVVERLGSKRPMAAWQHECNP